MTSSGAPRSMAQQLYVFVPPRRSWPGGARAGFHSSSSVAYLAVNADGSTDAGEAAVGALPRARAIDLVFDALDVYTATIEAPVLGEARLRQALPNLLEERMLADPADCHFASAPAGQATPAGDGPAAVGAAALLSVAAIDRSTLSRVLEAMAQSQLSPRAAYSELYLLPPPAGSTYCLRIAKGKGLLRTGRDQGCVFDPDDADAGTLGLAVRQFSIARLRVYGTPAEVGNARIVALSLALSSAASSAAATAAATAVSSAASSATPRVTSSATSSAPSPAAVAGAARVPAGAGRVAVETASREFDAAALAGAVNLLQGAFVASGGFGFSGRLLSRLARDGAWRAPAAWAAVCAVIAIGGLNAVWLQLDGRFQDLRASMHRVFRDGFPNEPDAYLLEQARRSVALLRARAGRPSADDFSVLNAQALQLLAAAPVGIVAGVEYADHVYRIRFKSGSADDPNLRNALQARAPGLGLGVHFDADGSARLAPSGS